MIITLIAGLVLIIGSILLLFKNNETDKAGKLALLVVIGIVGLAIESFALHRLIGLHSLNLNMGFVGAELIKSYILLAFGKNIQQMV